MLPTMMRTISGVVFGFVGEEIKKDNGYQKYLCFNGVGGVVIGPSTHLKMFDVISNHNCLYKIRQDTLNYLFKK
jgi:hypothetical protein